MLKKTGFSLKKALFSMKFKSTLGQFMLLRMNHDVQHSWWQEAKMHSKDVKIEKISQIEVYPRQASLTLGSKCQLQSKQIAASRHLSTMQRSSLIDFQFKGTSSCSCPWWHKALNLMTVLQVIETKQKYNVSYLSGRLRTKTMVIFRILLYISVPKQTWHCRLCNEL